MPTNTPTLDAATTIITKKGKHRDGNPFKNELTRFLRNPEGRYHFVSDDYYQCELVAVDGPVPVQLKVFSEKEEILTRAETVNKELEVLFKR